MKRSFTHGPGIDEVLGMTDYTGESPVDYFFHHDGMGSIVNITDASQLLKTTYTYNPFGEFTTTYNNGNIESQFTYAGREFSSATGLFHNRAREYMPSIGQFTSRDPYPFDTMSPNTIQRYNYCGNSPVNFVDPWGLDKDVQRLLNPVDSNNYSSNAYSIPLVTLVNSGKIPFGAISDAVFVGIYSINVPFVAKYGYLIPESYLDAKELPSDMNDMLLPDDSGYSNPYDVGGGGHNPFTDTVGDPTDNSGNPLSGCGGGGDTSISVSGGFSQGGGGFGQGGRESSGFCTSLGGAEAGCGIIVIAVCAGLIIGCYELDQEVAEDIEEDQESYEWWLEKYFDDDENGDNENELSLLGGCNLLRPEIASNKTGSMDCRIEIMNSGTYIP